jgi:hypothetical protein
VKHCLQALSKRFSDAVVKVDEATATAARLCKLYGTLACKGDSMPDRPHRRASIIETPERIEPVPLDALEALASEVPAAATPTSGAKRNPSTHDGFDIEQWLAQSGLEIIKGPESYRGGRRWTLRACPFNPEHQKPVVIELRSGALVYRCLHKSCSENDWKALRARIQPEYRECAQRTASVAARKSHPPAGSSADEAPLITDLVLDRLKQFYKTLP